MNLSQLTETLTRIYDDDGQRVVFWNDPECEFVDHVDGLLLPNVMMVRPDEIGALAAKILIELDSPEQRFLVYSTNSVPDPVDDWLLDVRLYSKTFAADKASILLDELGITTQSIRGHIVARKAFFTSKERSTRLKKWIYGDENAKDLDRKMIAVTIRASQPEPFTIFLKICGDFNDEFKSQSDSSSGSDSFREFEPAVWNEIERFGLAESFWSLAEETFGYSSETPRISEFLVRLFVSDLVNGDVDSLPQRVRPLALSAAQGARNASVFLANWRGSVDFLDKYRLISNTIEMETECGSWIGEIKVEKLYESETFEVVERRLIADIRDQLLAELPADVTELRGRVGSRRDRFWSRGIDSIYRTIYDALGAALAFFEVRMSHSEGFNFADAGTLLAAYKSELFQFDQSYRLFRENADPVLRTGRNILAPLVESVENAYGNWYLERLAINWSNCVDHANLLAAWSVDGIKNQYRFFNDFVRPAAFGSTERKVYVIVSDAFRFECAEELTRALNADARKSGNAIHEATLDAILGVVPSYTALGMAALLPHDALDYKINASGLDVQADGRSTSGVANRDLILSKHAGAAIKYDAITSMTRDEGREFVRQKRVIYIYHNRVDATGDTASTEEDTFNAVRRSIDELKDLVKTLFHMSGSQIFITADHGFLFQQSSPEILDKSELQVASGSAKVKKKRYVIDPEISPQANAWHGSIRSTAKIDGDMQFLIPKGANRFHFTGGSRFVHGGAMPQEIVVPVISVRKLQGDAAKRSEVKKAGVTLLGNLTRIVNNLQKLQFIQTEAVSDRVTPRTVQISIRGKNDELISNEETVTFDSQSGSMEDRVKEVQLTLRTGQYDKSGTYFILLNDSGMLLKEYLRIPVKIDIAFSSDF